MSGNKSSGRPAATWYLFASDIEQICDLPRSLDYYARKGELETENLMSLLTFTASHLTPTWRKKLQVDCTLTSLAGSTSLPDYKPILPVDQTDATVRLRWTIDSNMLMESLGCNQNQIHLAKCRKHLNCGKLISVLRFALFRARPLQKAAIISSLFSVAAAVPAPLKKDGSTI